MIILKLIKNTKSFYSLMLLMFFVFILLILFTGRQVYVNEKNKLNESVTTELQLTLQNFEYRLDDLKIEIRRLVSVMNQSNILTDPTETAISAFASDFLLDHNFLCMILLDKNNDIINRINNQAMLDDPSNFLSRDTNDIVKYIHFDDSSFNNITISNELNVVYLIKNVTSPMGNIEYNIAFFFTPELLLTYLPPNYAFLIKGGGVKWAPAATTFPLDFKVTDYEKSYDFNHFSDTQAIYYTQLSNSNSNFLLATVADTTHIKYSLLFNTLITVVVFCLFFLVIIILVYFRNIQINQLIDTQKATVVCLANLAEFKDNETADHLERTRHYGTLLSNKLRSLPAFKHKISNDYLENIGFASVLHDIGKVGVPDSILKKPGKLSLEEFDVIKKHTVFAKDILKELVEKHKINDIFFTLSYNIAAYHHEKWDGSGYPHGLSGDSIPLEARIFAICDVYDALRSERVYKDALSHEQSLSIINEGKGTHFDPAIVDVFNTCAEQFRQIHDTYILFYHQVAYSTFGNNKRELKVDWNSKLSVGIESIDNQHQVLLNKINFLIRSILEGKGDESVLSILNFLKAYADEHFSAEEKIMREMNHPEYEIHKNEHDAFRIQFKLIIDKVMKDGVQDGTLSEIERHLIKWLLNHITEMDIRIKLVSA